MTAARTAGLLLLLTALATAVSVPARLLADADQPTLVEALRAIMLSKPAYATGGAARLVSGVALLAAGWFLWRALAGYQRPTVGLAGVLLAASGLVTAVSGACALALVAVLPVTAAAVTGATATAMLVQVPDGVVLVSELRWITGTVGFTLAGLGLAALGPAQWRIGGMLKIGAAASVIIGVAMLFIWVDAATAMHRISGIAFLIWLIVSGVWLLAGRLKGPQISS